MTKQVDRTEMEGLNKTTHPALLTVLVVLMIAAMAVTVGAISNASITYPDGGDNISKTTNLTSSGDGDSEDVVINDHRQTMGYIGDAVLKSMNKPFKGAKKASVAQTDLKSNLTDAQKKLSTDLLQLVDSSFLPKGQNRETLESQMKHSRQFRPASSVSSTSGGRVAPDLVYVYVYLKPPARTQTIEPYVWEITDRDEDNHLAVAWVEVNDLETLASHEAVRTIRTVMPPLLRTGSVTTQGDAIHRTDDVRTNHSQNGSGVKVGIISDGVGNWTVARDSGDLPAGVTVLSDTVGGDEGTAMLEIVHDMVPEADLYFHDRGNNWIAFNNAINALVAAGCDIICDDIGWTTQPFFEDGIIASHVESVLASNDIIYVSAAGNDGDAHYQGDYYNDGNNSHDKVWYIDFDPDSSARIVLQWNDEFGASDNDYNLYLRDYYTEDVLAYSNCCQNGTGNPLEVIDYVNRGTSTVECFVVVANDNGAADTKTLEVFIYPDGARVYPNNINATDSIFGHPAVPDAIAVGAIDASDPDNDDIEDFSSQGPVTISHPSPVSRPKPDICGIDKVSITGAGGFGYWDGSNYRFSGTSAAAPHIAAIAAQLWGAFPAKTGDEIRTILYDSSVDINATGYDNVSGYGRADAFDAFGSVIPPNIATYAPNSSVNDIEGATRTFNVTVNQTVNVTWLINGSTIQTNVSATAASYTNTSAAIGVWNVSAVANNTNGTDMQVWIWTVTAAPLSCNYGDICVTESGWWRNGSTTFNSSSTRIQEAVDNATAGETIYVYNGSYTENVDVDTRLTLRGAGASGITVDAANSSLNVFNVTASYVNITGFTVTGATGVECAGIYLNGTQHCNITGNTASGSYGGIVLCGSSNNTLMSNTASGNTYGAVLDNSSNNNTVTSNTANSNTGFGIVLSSSSNNTLTSNNASNNDCGIVLRSSSNNTLTSNTASLNGDCGICMGYSSNDNTLSSNTANSNTDSGISLESSSDDNMLTGNTLTSNSNCDIYINSSTSTFTDNVLKGTTVSFTYNGNLSLKGVTSPETDPTGWRNLGKFISAADDNDASAWLFLNFTYSNANVTDLDESSLTVQKHNTTGWNESGAWNGTRHLDAANNVVGVKIVSFCTATFVPMAQINGSISGTVTDSSTGHTISDATVYVLNTAMSTIATETTGGNGKYMVSKVPPGTYTLNVTATNYAWNNDTSVVVSGGAANTSGNVELTAEKVTLALQSGETASKIAVKGNATVFNLTATNYGENTTYNITNSTTTATVKFNGLSAPVPPLVLNGSESVSFNVTVNHTTAGYYPVTITVNNSDSSKSASVTLYATMRNETGNTQIGSCNITGGTAEEGAVLNNASVLSGGTVNGSVIVNTTVETNATVEDGSTVEFSNVTNHATVTGGSIVINSNVTGIGSTVSNGALINESVLTNTTVSGSNIVNVDANDSSISGSFTINTGNAITLIGATVVASGGSAQITDGAIATRGVSFSDIYTPSLIDNLIINQIADMPFAANTPKSIDEVNKVRCNVTAKLTSDGTLNISRVTINPDGRGSVSGSTVIGNFLCIQCNNTTAVQNLTLKMYYITTTTYSGGVHMYYYNTTTSTWVQLETTDSGTSGGMNWLEAEPNHLTTFATMGTTTYTPPAHRSSGGGGTYPPATPTPTVTPTATPTATATPATAATAVNTVAPAKTAAPGMTAAGEADGASKKPKKRGLPGFEGAFAIAGLLAVAYLVMRKRQT